MALPVEGALRFSDIGSEIGILTPLSLREMSSAAGFQTPDSVGEFYGYTAGGGSLYPPKHFAIVNKVSRLGKWYGEYPRQDIDGGGYELYLKPSEANIGLNNYTLLDSFQGEGFSIYTETVPVYDKEGNIIDFKLVKIPLTFSHGKCITNLKVSYDSLGNPSYSVTQNSRGDEFYINLVQPYI